MRKRLRIAALLCVAGMAAFAFAQLSPGKLSKYHTELEGLNNCTQCHELRSDVSNAKCLACHTTIATRIENSKGYHASSDVQGKSCAVCHSEHHGLEFELVFWKEGREKFDHSRTQWKLEGAHAKQDCKSCHTAGLIRAEDIRAANHVDSSRTFLGLGTACLDCHRDEHGDQLSDDCLSCHTQNAWKPAEKFSHANTRFPLTGKHESTDCMKCHTLQNVSYSAEFKIEKSERRGQTAKYSGLNFSQCSDCHRDAHDGKFGSSCSSCHTTENFHSVAVAPGFDHSQTGFPLLGRHANVSCQKCHTGASMTDPVAHNQCVDCHRDEHRGQFADRINGIQCENCHTVDGFAPSHFTIDDHEKSRFPLTGSHLAIPCIACHVQTGMPPNTFAKFDFAGIACKDCHEDVHRGELAKFMEASGCESCHGTESWHQISFDHSKTKFPLAGKHSTTACASCHVRNSNELSGEFIRMNGLPMQCAECHEEPHRGQFAVNGVTDCAKCHSPESWNQLVFDHNRDARFALEGAHAAVACNLCHIPQQLESAVFIPYKPLGTECADCHSKN